MGAFVVRSALIAAFGLTFAPATLAQERPTNFVDAASAIPDLAVEMRYLGSNNFVGRRIDGYEKPICYLTREAVVALAAVARDLRAEGLGLKAFDCYRPARAVRHFVRWGRDLSDQTRKAEFYPEVEKRDLFREGYISQRSAHSRGSTIDLTLIRLADGRELNMGTPFDYFSPRSWPSDRSVARTAQQNRALLAQAMRRRGFAGYRKEWWHFTLRGEPYPKTYFDFPVR